MTRPKGRPRGSAVSPTVRIRAETWARIVEREGRPTEPGDEAQMIHALLERGLERRVEPTSWCFTFGCGQEHPVTHERLERRYVELPGTAEEARAEMVRRFRDVWGGQYALPYDGIARYGLVALTGDEALGLAVGK